MEQYSRPTSSSWLKQSITWTREMNEFVVPNYYRLREYVKYNGLEPSFKPKILKLIFKLKTKKILSEINEFIKTKMYKDMGIKALHITTLNGQIVEDMKQTTRIPMEKQQQPWKRKLNATIIALRKVITIFEKFQKPQARSKVKKYAELIIVGCR